MSEFNPRTTAAFGWSDERSELLKKLWAQGFSASQIARQLGGITRNAVIGKLHRLGLAGNGPHVTRQRPSAPARAPRAPAVARNRMAANGCNMKGAAAVKPALVFGHEGLKPKEEPAPAPLKTRAFDPLPGSSPKPWPERLAGQCAWPVGQGVGPELHHCCQPVYARGWCRAHFARGIAAPEKPQTANQMMRSLRRHVA